MPLCFVPVRQYICFNETSVQLDLCINLTSGLLQKKEQYFAAKEVHVLTWCICVTVAAMLRTIDYRNAVKVNCVLLSKRQYHSCVNNKYYWADLNSFQTSIELCSATRSSAPYEY